MYFSFSDFGVTEKDILFLEAEGPFLQHFLEDILSSNEIGIDTESHVARTKFSSEASLLALIQIATAKKVYLFDAK